MAIERASLADLPSEVLLDIFSRIGYSPALKRDLQGVNKRFKQIADAYEQCITTTILHTQFPWASRQFPGLLEQGRSTDWEELSHVFRRVAILANIKARCKVIREGNSEHSAWTTCRALTFHHAGLLLLYRLSDSGTSRSSTHRTATRADHCASTASHESRQSILQSLPKSSLAVLLFTLMISVHLLRAIGPQPSMYCPAAAAGPGVSDEVRSEIELATEELLLRLGPPFLLGLLTHDKAAIAALRDEVAGMDARQRYSNADSSSPDADGPPQSMPPPTMTLIATLRRAFAAQIGCDMRYALVHMWCVLDDDCAELAAGGTDEQGVREATERVVNGEELRRCCRRCREMRLRAQGVEQG